MNQPPDDYPGDSRRPLSEPAVTVLGDGYMLEWLDEGFRLEATRIRERSDDIHAEFEWFAQSGDGWVPLAGGSKVNLTSGIARTREAKALIARHGSDDFAWEPAMEKACAIVKQKWRDGAPVVRATSIPRSHQAGFLIDTILPADTTTICHADPQAGKSMLANALLHSIVTGIPFAGQYEVRRKGPVLYLDWERDEVDFGRRQELILNGIGMTEGVDLPVYYREMRGPIRDQVRRLREIIARYHIVATVIDSLGWAVGKELHEAGPVIEAMDAARQLGTTVLALAHQAKASQGQIANGQKTIYGSVFFEAAARYVWHMRSTAVDASGEKAILLVHKKSNDSPLIKRPLPLRLAFTDQAATFRVPPSTNEIGHGGINDQIVAALQRVNWQTAYQLSTILVIPDATMRKACDRLVSAHVIMKQGAKGEEAVYGLTAETVPQGPRGGENVAVGVSTPPASAAQANQAHTSPEGHSQGLPFEPNETTEERNNRGVCADCQSGLTRYSPEGVGYCDLHGFDPAMAKEG